MAIVDPSVINAEALVERFGRWRDFHDAEVLAVRLDSGQRSAGVPTLELDIHVFAAGEVRPDGKIDWVSHTCVTLLFENIEDVVLGDFGPQNVLFDLHMKKVVGGPTLRRVDVEMPASNGLSGSFTCESVTVLSAEPYDPGPHSVYGQSD